MFIVFFAFWLILNGRLTLEIAVFGLVISAAMYWFTCRYLSYRPRYDYIVLKNLPLLILYILILLREIVKANLTMAYYVFTHQVIPEPVLVAFHPPLRTNAARTLLANSITLTPGTITVDMHDGHFTVHCYDRSMAEGLDSSDFVRLLVKLEENL